MEERMEYAPLSLKHKLKHTICGCFKQAGLNHHHHHHPLHHHHHHFDDSSSSTDHHHHEEEPRLVRSSSGSGRRFLRSAKSEDIKDKCRHLFNRRNTPRGHHRKSHSTDFHYDPHSYSLNFDEGLDHDDLTIDELPLRNFSSRLRPSPLPSPRNINPPPPQAPSGVASPPSTPSGAPPREIIAYS